MDEILNGTRTRNGNTSRSEVVGEKRRLSTSSTVSVDKLSRSEMKDEIDELLHTASSPHKRRKISNGAATHALPVKADKESRKQQLKLLKQRMSRRRSMPSTLSSLSSARSISSSSSSSGSSYGSVPVQRLRRRSGSKLIGRRSHTLQLAAKGTLCGSPRAVCPLLLCSHSLFMMEILLLTL